MVPSQHEALERGRLRPFQYAMLALWTAALAGSGAALFAIRQFTAFPEDGFSVYRHPAEPWMTAAHVLAAPLFLAVVGSLSYRHVKRHWEAGLHRASGALTIGLVAAMTYSGYALYLTGEETLRKVSSWAHEGSSALFILTLAWHIVVGRRAKKRAPSPPSEGE